jgi:SH3-like domain-containing protein
MRFWIAFLLICLLTDPSWAKTKRPVPRFVSIRSTESNLRVGPGSDYPVDWVFVKNNIPVEITAEFDTWRRVRDFEGTEGWFHQSMLKSQRYGVISEPMAILYRSNSETSSGVAKLSQGVIVKIKKCRNDWCYVTLDQFDGWLPSSQLWGVYPDEKVG